MLKEGGRQATSGSCHRSSRILTVSEVALAFVLLVGAGLMINSVLRLQQVDVGYDPENLLTRQSPAGVLEIRRRPCFGRSERKSRTYERPPWPKASARQACHHSLTRSCLCPRISRPTHHETTQDPRAERDLLAGTLDMLILRMLQAGPAHGLRIAQDIERRSMTSSSWSKAPCILPSIAWTSAGWISSSWGLSDTNRRARFDELTPQGRKQLTAESSRGRR